MARRNRPDFRINVTIASELSAGRKIQKQVLDEVTRRGYNHQSIFAIKLCLEEALTNAIRHGNQLEPHKRVHIEVFINDQQSEIVIQDEGPGFDRAGVPDPTLEENLEKCSGRGILLIEAYMNQAEWSQGGRRLHMIKKNEADMLPRD